MTSLLDELRAKGQQLYEHEQPAVHELRGVVGAVIALLGQLAGPELADRVKAIETAASAVEGVAVEQASELLSQGGAAVSPPPAPVAPVAAAPAPAPTPTFLATATAPTVTTAPPAVDQSAQLAEQAALIDALRAQLAQATTAPTAPEQATGPFGQPLAPTVAP